MGVVTVRQREVGVVSGHGWGSGEAVINCVSFVSLEHVLYVTHFLLTACSVEKEQVKDSSIYWLFAH